MLADGAEEVSAFVDREWVFLTLVDGADNMTAVSPLLPLIEW
jgi:hypothetical protein